MGNSNSGPPVGSPRGDDLSPPVEPPKFGEGEGRGDEVPYMRHLHSLNEEALESGPRGPWAREFAKNVEKQIPSESDLARFKSEMHTAGEAVDGLPATRTENENGPSDISDDFPGEATPPAIVSAAEEILARSKSAADRWKAYERFSRIFHHGAPLLPGSVAIPLRESFEGLHNSHGLLGQKALGGPGGRKAEKLGRNLKTTLDSKVGVEVRAQLNRGLLITSSEQATEESRNEVRGAFGLIVGADAAAAAGRTEDAQDLLKLGTEALDLIIGATPLGLIPDLANLISGAATGFDLKGNPMGKGDYLLSGLGVVAGVWGGGAAIKLGGKPLGKAFLKGSKFLRESSLGKKLSKALSNIGKSDRVAEVTTGLGRLLEKGPVGRARDYVSAGIEKVKGSLDGWLKVIPGSRASNTVKETGLLPQIEKYTSRISKGNQKAIRIVQKDGKVLDISPKRVKEYIPNTHPNARPGSLQPIEFKDSLPGTKGLKRRPTEEDLMLLESLWKK